MPISFGDGAAEFRLGSDAVEEVRHGIEPVFGSPLSSVSGIYAWYDFSDASTITLNGSTISQIKDKSGNGLHLTQATAANQPTLTANAMNGRSAATFTGNQYIMASTANDWKFLHYGTDKYLVCAACKADSTYPYSGTLGLLGTGFWSGEEYGMSLSMYYAPAPSSSTLSGSIVQQPNGDGWVASPEIYPFNSADAAAIAAIGSPSAASPADALTLRLYESVVSTNFGDSAAADGAPATPFAIGSVSGPGAFGLLFPWRGIVCEVVIHRRSSAFTTQQVDATLSYLATKWNVPA